MKVIQIEIDCGKTYCGACDARFGGISEECSIFMGGIVSGKRLSECLQAEQKATPKTPTKGRERK